MNIFDIAEERIEGIFEQAGVSDLISFKRMTREIVHQMKRNAVKLDGRKYAPTLYTVMVSDEDNRVISAIYGQLTGELIDFVAHEAQNVGLEMADTPLVRFIADQSIKPGKYDVIAEVVPSNILDNLRQEEAGYVRSLQGGARQPDVVGVGASATRQRAGGPRGAARPAAAPAAQDMGAAGGVAGIGRAVGFDRAGSAPARRGAPTPHAAPTRAVPAAPAPAPAPQAPARRAATGTGRCTLQDLKTGQTWHVGSPTVIGREQSMADLVLNDSNVSRRHAQLTFTGGSWTITDLGSTNGTRVNGQRVSSSELHDGDTLTLGIIDLGFRES
ncbi:MAG: FhaA domain-containing protein [Coriobacteriales bacterium]|jgi:hypothetical protein